MKKLSAIIILLYPLVLLGQNTGITNWWLLGYGSWAGPPNGHTKMNFFNGVPIINSDSIEMDFDRTETNISDTAGNLLFYTNGYYIADATNDTMMNGGGISPTGFVNLAPYGLTVPQACLILPKPVSNNIYYLIHNTVDNTPYYNKSLNLYSSTIDINLNGGLGSVLNKNNILLQDTLNPGKITACKHANGRDWWIIVQRVNSNSYYKFLLTPTGISGPTIQNIGAIRTKFFGGACFSPDGKKYASFHAEYTINGELDILDFDRCTGMFSNPIHIIIPQSNGYSGGLAISPNSRFLYAANIQEVYQFDLSSGNIAASKLTIAQWDSFYSPSPPFATLFEQMQLAPDGKIYISTGNSTFHIHVINNPDSLGISCDLVQHAIQFQYFYANGLPNHPNYFLGCDTNSGCGCLVGIDNLSDLKGNTRAVPNPTTSIFTLQFPVKGITGELEIYNLMGSIILQEYVAPWSQYKTVDISNCPKGIYLCKLKWRESEMSVKVIKE